MQHASEINQGLQTLPPTTLLTVLMGDVNASVGWGSDISGLFPFGKDGKGIRMLDLLKSRSLEVHTPREGQRHLPTSRARKQGIQGNVIDMVASARVEMCPLSIARDSCDIIGTDHDMIASSVLLKCGQRGGRRYDTRPRVVVVKKVPQVEHIDEQVLCQIAKECTKGPLAKVIRTRRR